MIGKTAIVCAVIFTFSETKVSNAFSDEATCKNGALVLYDPTPIRLIQSVDDRVVACFNFKNKLVREAFNSLADKVDTLNSRVIILEAELSAMKKK